ncbi:MAG: hypothetical protein NW237_16140 [Cyanobacteriota bacterium]|nr:hypothetical protein [Cyanobacteriota bacterium]
MSWKRKNQSLSRRRIRSSVDLPRRQSWTIWGSTLLWVGMVILISQRLRLTLQKPSFHHQWWRSLPILQTTSDMDAGLSHSPPELPLYQGFSQFIAQVPAPELPSSFFLQGVALLGCLLILLGCWVKGNFWSAGLWGLSPWVISQGLEPGSEIFAAALLFWACQVRLPRRFIGLALACSLSARAWPIALLLTLLWTSQGWPRYRWQGVMLVGGSILINAIWYGGIPAWVQPLHDTFGAAVVWQSGLAVLAALMLPLGLTLVRLVWPWSHRQQALISLAAVIYIGLELTMLLLHSHGSVNWLQASARSGLVILPLLCVSAGGVLMEIPCLGWRRLLGTLLLGSSFLLSVQMIY